MTACEHKHNRRGFPCYRCAEDAARAAGADTFTYPATTVGTPEWCGHHEHQWPVRVACPECGKLDQVSTWEAWDCPSGDLFCWDCTGLNSAAPLERYWTFRGVGGTVEIEVWTEGEGAAA